MHDHSDPQTQSVERENNRGRFLVERLPRLREDTANEAYRAQSLEQCLEQAKDAVYALESMTVGSVFASLTGSRDRKLAARQTALRDVQQRYDDSLSRLQSLKRELESVEAELKTLPDYTELKTPKGQPASGASADAPAAPLSGDERVRLLRSAIESGRALLERLHALTSSVGRARNRSSGGRPLGALGAMAMDALGAQGAKGSVERARDGLRRFNEKVAAIEFSEGTELDLELIRLAAETRHFEAEFAARSVTELVMLGAAEGPLLDHVQNFIGLLDAKTEQITRK